MNTLPKQKLDHEDIIYSLCVADIQTVAQQEIGRTLTVKEIKEITDVIAMQIGWYDAIANSISEKNYE